MQDEKGFTFSFWTKINDGFWKATVNLNVRQLEVHLFSTISTDWKAWTLSNHFIPTNVSQRYTSINYIWIVRRGELRSRRESRRNNNEYNHHHVEWAAIRSHMLIMWWKASSSILLVFPFLSDLLQELNLIALPISYTEISFEDIYVWICSYIQQLFKNQANSKTTFSSTHSANIPNHSRTGVMRNNFSSILLWLQTKRKRFKPDSRQKHSIIS